MNTDKPWQLVSRATVWHLMVAALGVAGIGYLILSSEVKATREFNYGVKAYEEERFDAAVRYFSRSADLSPNPRAFYNMAVASWASVEEANEEAEDGAEASQEAVQQAIHTAREAITEALGSGRLDEEQILDLTYLEARLLVVEGRSEEARSRLRKALSLEEGFKPALRELVRLDDAEKPDPMRELLVTLAEDGEPKLITEYRSR